MRAMKFIIPMGTVLLVVGIAYLTGINPWLLTIIYFMGFGAGIAMTFFIVKEILEERS